MKEVFGIPVETLLVVLLVGLGIALSVLAALGVRNRILLKLAVRSVRRRRGRSALIVVGLMLGTTIIAAALTTGDTMSHTIRPTAVATLGATDETIAPKGAVDDIPGALGAATGTGWVAESAVARVESAVAGSGLVDGVSGAIVEQVAMQAPVQGQQEPSVVLFAGDPARMDGFSPIRGSGGATLSLADLGQREVYLNTKAARELLVEAGDRVVIFTGRSPVSVRVRDVVRFDGAGSADASVLVSLDQAQRLLDREGQVKAILVSNRGGDVTGAARSDDVVALLEPVANSLGLEIQTLKADAIEDADAAGNAFMAFFTTFGTFSIAAGILLIFLIFVMLAVEVDDVGGGFHVRAGTNGAAPVDDMTAAVRRTPGVDARDFTAVGSQSVHAVEAKQVGAGRPFETYLVRGLDAPFLEHTTFGLGDIARGYGSEQEVWAAVRKRPGLAVVDSMIVPRRDNWDFGVLPDFQLSGFYFEEGFEPIPVEVLDKQTGKRARLTVIGILKDTAPLEMVGISTSEQTLAAAFPGGMQPTIHYFALAPGVDPENAAAELESAFLASGLEAESIQQVVDDAVAANVTFNRLIQGFMGLGLMVGVAALGVISARAVVERRQQIGVMRAIGFRTGVVQAAFLLESSFVALTSIVVGTALGLLLSWNIIRDQQAQPSWENLELVVPWLNLAVIFLVVYAVALAATLAPAMRASRIRPAEALRYQ